jgi:hypothetical protein
MMNKGGLTEKPAPNPHKHIPGIARSGDFG